MLSETDRCDDCEGAGIVRGDGRTSIGGFSVPFYDCPSCQGFGQFTDCPCCRGRGCWDCNNGRVAGP